MPNIKLSKAQKALIVTALALLGLVFFYSPEFDEWDAYCNTLIDCYDNTNYTCVKTLIGGTNITLKDCNYTSFEEINTIKDGEMYVGNNISIDKENIPIYALNVTACNDMGLCKTPVIIDKISDKNEIIPLVIKTNLNVPYEIWGLHNKTYTRTIYNSTNNTVACKEVWVNVSNAFLCEGVYYPCQLLEKGICSYNTSSPIGYYDETLEVFGRLEVDEILIHTNRTNNFEIRYKPETESGKLDVLAYTPDDILVGDIDPYWTGVAGSGNWYAIGKYYERPGSVDYNLIGPLLAGNWTDANCGEGNSYGGNALLDRTEDDVFYCIGANTVEAWNLTSNLTLWSSIIRGGNSPMAGMNDGDGHIWYTQWEGGLLNITKIDTDDGAILCDYHGTDSYAYFSPIITDEDIVVTYSTSSKLYGINMADCTYSWDTACVLSFYSYVAYDGNRIYAQCSGGTEQIDATDGSVNASWTGAGGTSQGIALDADYVFIGDADGVLWLNRSTGVTEAENTETSGLPLGGFTINGDGTLLIHMRINDTGGSLHVFDIEAKTTVCRTADIPVFAGNAVPMTCSADVLNAYCPTGSGAGTDGMIIVDLSDCTTSTIEFPNSQDQLKQPIIFENNIYMQGDVDIYHFIASTTTTTTTAASSSSSSSSTSSSSSSIVSMGSTSSSDYSSSSTSSSSSSSIVSMGSTSSSEYSSSSSSSSVESMGSTSSSEYSSSSSSSTSSSSIVSMGSTSSSEYSSSSSTSSSSSSIVSMGSTSSSGYSSSSSTSSSSSSIVSMGSTSSSEYSSSSSSSSVVSIGSTSSSEYSSSSSSSSVESMGSTSSSGYSSSSSTSSSSSSIVSMGSISSSAYSTSSSSSSYASSTSVASSTSSSSSSSIGSSSTSSSSSSSEESIVSSSSSSIQSSTSSKGSSTSSSSSSSSTSWASSSTSSSSKISSSAYSSTSARSSFSSSSSSAISIVTSSAVSSSSSSSSSTSSYASSSSAISSIVSSSAVSSSSSSSSVVSSTVSLSSSSSSSSFVASTSSSVISSSSSSSIVSSSAVSFISSLGSSSSSTSSSSSAVSSSSSSSSIPSTTLVAQYGVWSNCTHDYGWNNNYDNFTIRMNTTLGWCMLYANMTTTNETNTSGSVWYTCPYGIVNETLVSEGLHSFMNWSSANMSNITTPPYCYMEGLGWVNVSLNVTGAYEPGFGIENIPYWIILLLGFGTLAGGWQVFKYYV